MVETRGHVNHLVLYRAQLVGALLDGGQLPGREAAGIDDDGVHFQVELARQIDGAKRGVEAAAIGENGFFLHFYGPVSISLPLDK